MQIQNPVLPGAYPDPSCVRVGNDFFLATSSFTWLPGIPLFHSKDLVHWRNIGHALTRPSQIDLKGVPSAGGVWAPCLTHDGEMFYLTYTERRSYGGRFGDIDNRLLTAPRITGPWSDPIFLNGSGIDPSLFHGPDGRKWFVNHLRDFRPGRNVFGGILLQEYDPKKGHLTGPVHRIFSGTPRGGTEGPHLYYRNGTYYLMVAEGGTGWDHGVVVARSKEITGPYEVDPEEPLLTSKGAPEGSLQKAGHGCLFDTPNGEWYLSHLASRPLPGGKSVLGRETCLQKVRWTDDGWLRLEGGGRYPFHSFPAPALPPSPVPPEPVEVSFAESRLPSGWDTPRRFPSSEWVSFPKEGGIALRGEESLSSKFELSLVAHRQQSFSGRLQADLTFESESMFQMAGLVAFYDTDNWYYLHRTFHEAHGAVLQVYRCDHGVIEEVLPAPIPLESKGPVGLRLSWENLELRMEARIGGGPWIAVGGPLDLAMLSDEAVSKGGGAGYTGNYVGLTAQDLSGREAWARFDGVRLSQGDSKATVAR